MARAAGRFFMPRPPCRSGRARVAPRLAAAPSEFGAGAGHARNAAQRTNLGGWLLGAAAAAAATRIAEDFKVSNPPSAASKVHAESHTHHRSQVKNLLRSDPLRVMRYPNAKCIAVAVPKIDHDLLGHVVPVGTTSTLYQCSICGLYMRAQGPSSKVGFVPTLMVR